MTLSLIFAIAVAKIEVYIPELTSITIIVSILSLNHANILFSGKKLSLSKIDIPVILLAILYLISMLVKSQYTNIISIYKYSLSIVLFIVVRTINIRSHDFLWSIWFVGLLESLFILCHYYVINLHYNGIRIVTHFCNPALAGCLLSLSLISIVLFIKLGVQSNRVRWFYILSIPVLLFPIIIIDSRAAFIALVFALLLVNINEIRRIVLANKCIVYILIITTLFGIFLLYNYRPDSVHGRFLIWRIALANLSDNFITGQGVNSFEATYMFNQADFFSENVGIVYQNVADNVYQVFNLFIKSLYEIGIMGCMLLFLIMVPIVKAIFSNDKELRYTGIMTLMIFIFSLFGYPEDSVILLSIWIILYAICINRMVINSQCTCMRMRVRFRAVAIIILFVIIPLLSWNWWKMRKIENVLEQEGLVAVLGERAIMDLPMIPEVWHRVAFDTYKNVNDTKLKERIISKALSVAPHSELCVYLGNLYMDNCQYLLAENYYEMASNMVPALIYPRYKLFKLYEVTGQTSKTKKIGEEILNMEIKIVISLVLKIKNEVRVKIAQISESPK